MRKSRDAGWGIWGAGYKLVTIIVLFFGTLAVAKAESRLPFSTVFKGRDRFDSLVAKASSNLFTRRY